MVKLALLLVLLTGCATPPPALVEEPLPVEPEIVDETPAAAEERRVRARKPPPVKPPDKPPPVKLPPCESVPGDKQTAILQKLDCLAETANRPAPPLK